MSAVKSLGRRLFARAAVGVPTALKFGQYNPPPRGMAACGGPPSAVGQSATDAAKWAFKEKVWKALRTGKAQQESEREGVRDMRRMMMGGLDPDLAVLNSMSLGRRVSLQIEREKEVRERHKGLRASIIRMMGGNPEDFD